MFYFSSKTNNTSWSETRGASYCVKYIKVYWWDAKYRVDILVWVLNFSLLYIWKERKWKNENDCNDKSLQFGHLMWIVSEVLHFFVTGHSHSHAPFLPFDPNSWSAVVWPMTNLATKPCAGVWIHLEVMHLFAIGHSHCHTPFSPTSMNTNTP